MRFPLPAFIVAASVVIAAPSVAFAAETTPKIDVAKSCQGVVTRPMWAAPTAVASRALPRRKRKAAGDTDQQQLGATWPPRDRDALRAAWPPLGGMAMASYVEMLTCLEIARETKTLPADIKRSGLPKQ